MRLSVIALFFLLLIVAIAGTDINHASGAKLNHTSGNVLETQPSQTTEVQHYKYNPPHKIRYDLTGHPVFHGQLPVYVLEYRNSGSKFDILLTGLALYNLGRNSNYRNFGPDKLYSSPRGEICKLRVSKGPFKNDPNNGEYEEARINCNIMSSFIWDETLMEDALNVKGKTIRVKPGMTCSMIRSFGGRDTMRRHLDCELLQEYERSSLSGAQCLTPLMTMIFNFLLIYLVRY